jgi:spermidine synthase
VLQRNDSAYPLFNLFGHALAFAVMLPATFLAGMTLPLFTQVLLRGGRGERAIGQVYAANTLGAIAGVLLAVHVLMPAFGLKLALVVGAAIDILLGTWVLRYSQAASRRTHAFAAVIVGMLAATATARAAILEPERLSSGVFRDGKTASVAVRGREGALSILTNGKSDAALRLDANQPPTQDEFTMTLLGALPLLIKPNAKTFANIGWGSGLSVEVALSHSGPVLVDTVEIEPAMVAGAHWFSPRVDRAFRDARSHVHFEDAKSYFARHGKLYDVIMSEPSNLWVNGVAALFTTEFYRDTKRYLAPGGLFVQWLHAYDFNDRLLGSVVSALGENFADYEIYESNPGDLMVVAVAEGRVPRPKPLPEKEEAFMGQLRRIGITRSEEIDVRSLGARKQIGPLFAALGAPVNSDFHPLVQLEAPRSRFNGSMARAVQELAAAPLPILEMTGGTHGVYLKQPAPDYVFSFPLRIQSAALEIARVLADRSAEPLRSSEATAIPILLALKRPAALCGDEPPKTALELLHRAGEITLANLAPEKRRALWVEHKWLECTPRSSRVRERFELYGAIAARDAHAMLARARALLEGPAQGGDEWRRYLLGTAMLGAYAAGKREEGLRLWKTFGSTLYPRGEIPPHMVYLTNLQ